MEFTSLFTPLKVRGIEFKNRIIMTGMGTKMNDQSFITDQLIGYHARRAAGGVAMNTLEVCSVDDKSAPKNFVSIADDRFLPGHKKLVEAIHENGGLANIQLWQGAMAVGSDPDAEIIFINEVDENRIYEIIENYGKAAARAREAGYDAVEFHAAHTYLPHMFLSGAMNFRQDEWGGSLENRMRFPLACVKAIRENISNDMVMFMRVDCFDDNLPGGLTIEEVIEFCKKAGENGVDILNISRGNFMDMDALIYETPPMDVPHFYNVEAAARIRKETGMLTMPTGRFNFPEMAEQVLREDKADLIVMARAQLADPDFCTKVKEGRLSNIKYCIGCDQGCYDYFVNPEKPHISCLRNPAVGKEKEYEIVKVDEPKRVMIIGGGVGGLEAADILHDRGHIPMLYEKTGGLGGQFMLAGRAPRKDDTYRAMKLFAQNAYDLGVDIHLNTEVTPELIKEVAPDAVIIACGSDPVIPRIPGFDCKSVVEARKLLGSDDVKSEKAVVIGGGLVGMEAAEFLAAKGVSVDVIEMKDSVLGEMGEMRKIGTRLALEKEPVTIHLSTTCKEIREDGVVAETAGEEIFIGADTVVLAIGSKPRPTEALIETCKELGIESYVIGDAVAAPRLALNAIEEAFKAAFAI